jgi:TatD DNase family protein
MYIDAHNHLELYQDNIEEALTRISQHKIFTLACSMDEKSYLYAKDIALFNPMVVPCFGIHPWEAHKYHDELDLFDIYIKETPIIGEIGLDYYWVEEKYKHPYQRKVLNYFLQRAQEYDKITNLHTKGAEEEILFLIKKYNLRSPIIHWYSGPLDTLKKLLDYGCYFTVSVDIGYSEITDEMVKLLPMNRILTETDGPTALEWVNGEYAYPDYVKRVVKEIATIKGLDAEQVKDIVYKNYLSFIKL